MLQILIHYSGWKKETKQKRKHEVVDLKRLKASPSPLLSSSCFPSGVSERKKRSSGGKLAPMCCLRQLLQQLASWMCWPESTRDCPEDHDPPWPTFALSKGETCDRIPFFFASSSIVRQLHTVALKSTFTPLIWKNKKPELLRERKRLLPRSGWKSLLLNYACMHCSDTSCTQSIHFVAMFNLGAVNILSHHRGEC